jgi:hypothetical protein
MAVQHRWNPRSSNATVKDVIGFNQYDKTGALLESGR